jgi:hypothetical protein
LALNQRYDLGIPVTLPNEQAGTVAGAGMMSGAGYR